MARRALTRFLASPNVEVRNPFTRKRDALCVFAVALAARLAVVAWARGRFPAVEDAHYYDVLARRIASGQGYTWLWPDGVVTYVAHYPVGYPALLAAVYALAGPSGTAAMLVNAFLGAASALGMHRLVDQPGGARWRPVAAGLAVAFHPALVPYTAALMTEGVTASLLVLAATAVATARAQVGGKARRRAAGWTALAGVVMGVATLVRPQSLVLAPVLGAFAAPVGARVRPRVRFAAALTLVAFACVVPWTARNCTRMHRCVLVSANEGWNLLIGAKTSHGGWEPVVVPDACAAVWDEAAKDRCFASAARRSIASDPLAWLARAPDKIAMTLDYFGAAPWYLHASNQGAFDDKARTILAAVETVASRLFLMGALAASGCLEGPRRCARLWVAWIGGASALTMHAWLGYVALASCVALAGARAVGRSPLIAASTAAVVAATVAVHAVFFGAGRYGLVVAPFVAGLAFAAPRKPRARAKSPGAQVDVAL